MKPFSVIRVLILVSFLSLTGFPQSGQPDAGNRFALIPVQLWPKLASGRLVVHLAEKLASQRHENMTASAQSFRVVIYQHAPPSVSEIESMAGLGVTCFPQTWTPPMDNHPLGFYLAEVPFSKIVDVLSLDHIIKLGTAEGMNVPKNNVAGRKIRAPAAWSRGWTGKGVKVGVIDSGIDTSRTGTDLPVCIEKKNYSRYPNIDDDVVNRITGHGTHVAATAVGRGALSADNTANGGGPYKGIAPESCLAFIKIGNDSSASADDAVIIGALHDMVTVYHARVVNLSYGGWSAYHDGSDAVEQKADWCYTQGTSMVFSAGNEARSGRHAMGTVPGKGESDFIEVRVNGIKAGQSRLSFNLVWFNGPGAPRNLTLKYFDAGKNEITDSLNVAPTTTSPRGTSSQYSSRQPWLPAGSSTWYVKVANSSDSDQVYHVYEDWFEWAWWTQGSISFTNASQSYTVGSPSTADHALSVAAYTSRSFYTGALGGMRQYSQVLDKLATFSSRGPRVDGAQKPDIAAPGTALVSLRDTNIYHTADNGWVDNDGVPGGNADYVVMQGTSMAAPVVTGAVSLVLSKYPSLTPGQVYDSLRLHAVRDEYTGAVPNASWGTGKVDVGFLAELPTVPKDGWVNVSKSGWNALTAGAVAQDPQGNVYATIGKPLTNEDATLYRSTDNGATWTGIMTEKGLAHVTTRSNGNVYAARRFAGKIYRSTNGGAAWTELGPDRDYTAITLAAGDSLFAAATSGQGVFTSSDDGATWNAINTGLPAARTVPVLVPGKNGWLYACANDNNVVHFFRAHRSDFTWQRSDNGMDTSKNVNACSTMPDGTVFAVVWDRVYRSEDNGAAWKQMAILNDNLQSVHALSNSTVLIGTTGAGVYRSTDRGATWESFSEGLTTMNIGGMNSAQVANTYATGSPGSVFRRSMGALPFAPALIMPSDNAVGVPHPVLLQWSPVTGAASYTLELSARPDFASTLLRVEKLAATQWPVSKLEVLTSHYWRVRANSNAGAGPWSAVWTFTTARLAPPMPLPTEPANGASAVGLPVRFAWTPSMTAASYALQVATDTSFANPVYSDASITGTSREVSTLAVNTTYYWRINAGNEGGSSAWSAVWKFDTRLPIPSAPRLENPANKAAFIAVPVPFVWGFEKYAASYRLQVSTDSSFASPVADIDSIPTFSKQVGGLSEITRYYWRVLAANVSGQSPWSETWNFTTAQLTFPAPDRTSPPDGAKMVPVATRFVWTAPPGASVYHVQVAADSNFTACIVNDSNLVSTSWTVNPLTYYTEHFWRVRATYNSGVSPWSTAWKFTTTLAPPALVSPADNATSVPLTPVFTWDKTTGATMYRLEIADNPGFSPPVLDKADNSGLSYSGSTLAAATRHYWRVTGRNTDGDGETSTIFTFVTASGTAADNLPAAEIPFLEQAHPNPARGMVELGFRIGGAGGFVTIRVIDLLGRTVATIAEGAFTPGPHHARYDVSSLPPGVYAVTLSMKAGTAVRMMTVAK